MGHNHPIYPGTTDTLDLKPTPPVDHSVTPLPYNTSTSFLIRGKHALVALC